MAPASTAPSLCPSPTRYGSGIPRRWLRPLVVAVAMVASPGHATVADPIPPGMTERQHDLLVYAWHEGMKRNLAVTTASILLQESSAGTDHKVGDRSNGFGRRSYGVMQLQLRAAYDALEHCPELGSFRTEEEVIARLIHDDRWNIRVGVCFLDRLNSRTNMTWRELITAYNRGIQGSRAVDPDSFPYTLGVVAHATAGGLVGDNRAYFQRKAEERYGPALRDRERPATEVAIDLPLYWH
ncbi:hypothetical protein [Aquisalimonas sp.]|uniref:hypothetical protein n=1 Tax=unclassified Aquisalimonas TaxID=2644645 RepID=UPI0025BD6AE6|nr:hypothetical protein [Aquisalimonas sp.]